MSRPTLLIENLKLGFKSYAGLSQVLHGISLQIAQGAQVLAGALRRLAG